MPLYNERVLFGTLSWSYVFPDADTFIEKLTEFGAEFEEMEKLYHIMARKYIASQSRYMLVEPFVMAIIRELQYAWPLYLEQESLMNQIKDIEIEEIMKSQSSLMNVVHSHDDPIVDADKIAISNLSNQQQVTRITGNRLIALMTKYESIQRNYLNQLYRRLDPLFSIFLSDEGSIKIFQNEDYETEGEEND